MGSTHTTRIRRGPRRGPVAAVLLGTIALAACGGGGDDASSATAADAMAVEEATMDVGAAGDESFLSIDDTGQPAAAERPNRTEGGFDLGVIGRDVIVEMRVVVSSDDIERTVASVTAAASALGGGVASSDVQFRNDDLTGSDGYAVLVVKVPPETIDRLLSGLDDTGTVESINQSAQDVTEQLVDLDVRIENARRSVDNVRGFMDRTENLDELVRLEAELTRRQTELEQLEAQERNLSERVALSTITIEVVPTAAVPESPADEDESIGDAFRSGWEAFVAVLFGIGFVFAATLPFLVSGLIVALVVWMAVRRRGEQRNTAPFADRRPTAPEPAASADIEEQERESEPIARP